MVKPPLSNRPWMGSLRVVLESFVFALGDSEVLNQDVRSSVYEHVQAYPGLHLSQIARDLEITTNHAKYHLRVLEDRDLITSNRLDGYWRFFPKEKGQIYNRDLIGQDEKEVLSLLRRPVPFKITVYLLRHGEGYNQQFAQAAEVSPSTSHYHLDKMHEAGMVERREEGRSVVYELDDADRIRLLLDQFEPPDALVQGFLEGWEALEL